VVVRIVAKRHADSSVLTGQQRVYCGISLYTSHCMSSSPAHLEVGNVIGDYQIVSLIGQGGMGKVFKVRNVISDRTEGMKVVVPDLKSAPELAERFQREIRVVAGLEHPNIAALRTALRVGNQLLMIMEFVEGQSLNELLTLGRFDEARAVHL